VTLETAVNAAEFSFAIAGINYILKWIQIKNVIVNSKYISD